jgi:hypothetical protein
MHTSLRVIGVLPDLEMSVVRSLNLGGWTAAKAVHEPSLVVPADPRRGDVHQVGEGTQRAAAERRTERSPRVSMLSLVPAPIERR